MERDSAAHGLTAAASTDFAPQLEDAPLPAADAPALLRRNAAEHAERPALRFGDRVWTHRELLAEAERFAALYRSRLDPGLPPHVGVLLDNTPDYVFALCGAALAGVAVAGLNYTRRGEHLARDVSHTDLQLVITEPRHQALLESALGSAGLPGGLLVSGRFADADDPPPAGESLDAALASAASGSPGGTDVAGERRRTSRPCGCFCSRPGRRPPPRRCAAHSAGCSAPGTAWRPCSS